MATTKTVKSVSVPATEPAEPLKAAEEAVSIQRDSIEPPAIQSLVKAGPGIFKSYEDLLQFNKETLEALIYSANIFVRGVQDLSHSVVALAQTSLEDSVAAGKALAGAKTFREVVDLSSSLAQSNFDKLVEESQKLGELSSRLAEEAAAPISRRVDAAVQSLTKIAA